MLKWPPFRPEHTGQPLGYVPGCGTARVIHDIPNYFEDHSKTTPIIKMNGSAHTGDLSNQEINNP